MPKAIITGATGYIGSKLTRKLIYLGWEVTAITREDSNLSNLPKVGLRYFNYKRNLNQLKKVFQENNFDVVFHLASIPNFDENKDDIDAIIESNLILGIHILEAMKNSKTKYLINTGTYWENNTENNCPVNLYAATKKSYSDLVEYYCKTYDVKAITLMLFDTYDENDTRMKILNLINKYSKGKEVLKMTSGYQELELIYIDDVLNAYLKSYTFISNNNIVCEKYWVGNHNPITLRDLVQLFSEITGRELTINWGALEYRRNQIMKLPIDYNTLPNWCADLSLQQGLEKFK